MPEVVTKRDAVVIGAHNQTECAARRPALLKRQAQLPPVIADKPVVAEPIFPLTIVPGRDSVQDRRLRAKPGAALEFETERRIRHHGFPIDLDPVAKARARRRR